jgi:hypothetical protein
MTPETRTPAGFANAKLISESADSVQNLAQEQLGAFMLRMVEEG